MTQPARGPNATTLRSDADRHASKAEAGSSLPAHSSPASSPLRPSSRLTRRAIVSVNARRSAAIRRGSAWKACGNGTWGEVSAPRPTLDALGGCF